jgi:hypothetical protein
MTELGLKWEKLSQKSLAKTQVATGGLQVRALNELEVSDQAQGGR